MVRTQIQLTEEQAERVKDLARREDVSMAELVRRGVELVLQGDSGPSRRELRDRARRSLGRFRSGLSDASARHDDYLARAYLE